MARTEGRIKCAIWRSPEFRGLTPNAQRAYFLILSQPGMSYCGVVSYRPKPWALLSTGTTPAVVEKAVKELAGARYVMVDRGTEELWVRTFVNHDGVLDQPKLIMAMAHDFGAIESEPIREGLVAQIPQGFIEGLAHRFPKANAQGFFQGLPEPFTSALAGGRSVFPNPQPPTPNPGSVPAVPDPGQVILQRWWDESDPKPAQPWPAMLAIVRKMLSVGWSEDDVAWAIRDAPCVSGAALTLSLKKRNGTTSTGNGPATRSEKAMLAWLASEEAKA